MLRERLPQTGRSFLQVPLPLRVGPPSTSSIQFSRRWIHVRNAPVDVVAPVALVVAGGPVGTLNNQSPREKLRSVDSLIMTSGVAFRGLGLRSGYGPAVLRICSAEQYTSDGLH